jgi:hypothetical protein
VQAHSGLPTVTGVALATPTGIGRDSSNNIFAVDADNRRVAVSTSAAPAFNFQ